MTAAPAADAAPPRSCLGCVHADGVTGHWPYARRCEALSHPDASVSARWARGTERIFGKRPCGPEARLYWAKGA